MLLHTLDQQASTLRHGTWFVRFYEAKGGIPRND